MTAMVEWGDKQPPTSHIDRKRWRCFRTKFLWKNFFRTMLVVLAWESMFFYQYMQFRQVPLSNGYTEPPTTTSVAIPEATPDHVKNDMPWINGYREASTLPGEPKCRIDPSILQGYSPEEVKTFFSRPRPLLSCPQRYPPYTSWDNASKSFVLDERRELSAKYVYAVYPTAGEGGFIHAGSKKLQWQDMPTNSNTSLLAVPASEQDELMFVKKKPSWSLLKSASKDAVTRSGIQSTRVHLRAAVQPKVVQAQAEKRKVWLEELKGHNETGQLLLDSPTVNIIHLDYDSVSRSHFRRMLPQTTAILDLWAAQGQGTTHELLDFRLHNVIADNTLPNMVPFLYGWDRNGKNPPNKSKRYVLNNVMPLFEAAKQAGFVTAFLQDDMTSSLAHKSKNPAHHSPNHAWTLLRSAVQYNDLSQNTRCLGDRPSSQVALAYVQSFLDAYKDQSTFTFAHLGDGHETTGTVIQTADAPLAAFLQSVLHGDVGQDTIVILSGDHGMRYGGWRKSMKGFLEHKLPPLYMILPHKITERFPDAMETLRANTGLINSKLDLHVTLKNLFGFPDDNRNSSNIQAQSLLQPVPLERTCAHAGIPEEYCSCTPWQKPTLVADATNHTSTIGNPSPKQIVEIFLREIRGMLGAPNKKNLRDPCSRQLKVHTIDSEGLLTQEIEPPDFLQWNPNTKATLQRNFKVSFTTIVGEDLATIAAGEDSVTEATTTTWEGILNLRLYAPKDLEVSADQGFPSRAGSLFPSEIYTVRSLERPSEWPMACRNQAVAAALDPKYCVCPRTAV